MIDSQETPVAPRVAVGECVLVRTYSAGVVVGTLASRDGREVILRDARRIWRWDGAATLHELATLGPSRPEGCRIPAPVPEVLLTEAIEILAVTPTARERIEAVPAWTEH